MILSEEGLKFCERLSANRTRRRRLTMQQYVLQYVQVALGQECPSFFFFPWRDQIYACSIRRGRNATYESYLNWKWNWRMTHGLVRQSSNLALGTQTKTNQIFSKPQFILQIITKKKYIHNTIFLFAIHMKIHWIANQPDK